MNVTEALPLPSPCFLAHLMKKASTGRQRTKVDAGQGDGIRGRMKKLAELRGKQAKEVSV